MTLTQRLSRGWSAAIKSSTSASPFVGINDPRYSSFMGINTYDQLGNTPLSRIEIAKRAVWVHACIVSRANVIKDIPMKLYRRNDKGVKEEVRQHPAGELLLDVNPVRDTPASIRAATEQGLCIHGRYTWVKVRNQAGVVKELYGLPQQFVKIIPDNKWIKEFVYEYSLQNGGKARESYDVADVVYFRYIPPDDGVEGFAPLMVALETTRADLGIVKGQNAMLDNAGRPSVIITMPNKLNDPDYARENERVQRSYAGAVNTGKIWLIDNASDTKVTPVQLSPKELEWISQHKSHIKDVCAAFNVTPGMVGEFAEASRLANAGAMHRFYGETFVRPELQLWEDTINWQLLWTEDWGHGIGWEREQGMFFEHDLANVSMFREDESAMSIRAKESMQAAASIDQVLEMQGLPPVGGLRGDLRFVPTNFVPLDSFLVKPEMIENETSDIESPVEYAAEYQRKERTNTQMSPAYTDTKEKPDLQAAKSVELNQYKKWRKKHDPMKDNFEFKALNDEEQEELLGESRPTISRDLEVEVRATLARMKDMMAMPTPVPQQPSNVTVNFPPMTIPVTNNLPAQNIEVRTPQQQIPNVVVNVEPTPYQITNNMPEMNVTVQPSPPTPITIENQVNPTPVDVRVDAPVVNVQNDNTINVPTQAVDLKISPRTEVVERDENGRIKKIRQEHDVSDS